MIGRGVSLRECIIFCCITFFFDTVICTVYIVYWYKTFNFAVSDKICKVWRSGGAKTSSQHSPYSFGVKMFSMYLMTWELFYFLLWHCPAYVSKSNGCRRSLVYSRYIFFMSFLFYLFTSISNRLFSTSFLGSHCMLIPFTLIYLYIFFNVI